MAQVCEALAAVHAAGFVHRDLKPENVYFVSTGASEEFVKLLDFGLVKVTRARCGVRRERRVEGTFLGSPAYASPEQAMGKEVDGRTDVYAVGVMLSTARHGPVCPSMAKSIGDMLARQVNPRRRRICRKACWRPTPGGRSTPSSRPARQESGGPRVVGGGAGDRLPRARSRGGGARRSEADEDPSHAPNGLAVPVAKMPVGGAIASLVAVLLVALAFGRYHTSVMTPTVGGGHGGRGRGGERLHLRRDRDGGCSGVH